MFPPLPSLAVDFSSETLTAIVNFVVIAGGVVVSIFGSVWGVKRLQRQEWWERAQPALDTKMRIRTFPFMTSEGKRAAILELDIWIKNLSSDTWMVPALYFSARSMPCARAKEEPCHGVEHQFERLPPIGELSEPKNIAFLEGSIYQISPNEAEQFVCWIHLDETAIKQNPVMMIRADIFLAPHLRIGYKHSRKRKPGKDREEWIKFMRGHERCSPQKIPFHKTSTPIPEFSLRASEWALLKPGGTPLEFGTPSLLDAIDGVSTRRFKKVLSSFWSLSRERAVDVAALGTEEFGQRPHQEPSYSREKATDHRPLTLRH